MKLLINLYKSRENIFLGTAGIIALFLFWHLLTFRNLISPIFLSKPQEALNELFYFFKDGTIYPDLKISAQEFLIGFIFALFFGIFLGFVIGWFKKVKAISNPLIFALYATPTIAIIPLIVLWFGIGMASKSIIVFLASFFPILISIMEAVKNTDHDLIKLARSFTASDVQTLTKIVVPNSIPNIISGIKIALPRGFIGMIIGEFYTGNVGLGYLISYYGATFQTARLLAVVLLIMLISVCFTFAIDMLEKKIKLGFK